MKNSVNASANSLQMISLLVCLGFLWGSSFPLAKYVMSLGVAPLNYALYQSLGSFIFLLGYNYFIATKPFFKTTSSSRGLTAGSRESQMDPGLPRSRSESGTTAAERGNPAVKPRDDGFFSNSAKWLYYFTRNKFFAKRNILFTKSFIIAGFLGVVIPNINWYCLTKELPVGILALAVNTSPLFVYLIAVMWQEEIFALKRLFGVMVGFAGITFIVFSHYALNHISINHYVLLAFISPLSYALCSVYISKTAAKVGNSGLYAAGMLYFSAFFIFIFMLISKQQVIIYVPAKALYGILIEIILSGLGYIVLFKILKKFGAVCYSTTDGIVIITSLIWGYIFFHEMIGFKVLIAALFIIAGIILVTLKSSQQQEERI